MRVTFPQEDQKFGIKYGEIAGDECALVTPDHVAPAWDDDNKIFRSSIWTKGGKPVSLGFKKFTNWGERPLFEPFPADRPFTAVEKLDGSCLIVSKYKGELIVRTRGTFDASKLDNGHEIELLKEKYPDAFDNSYLNNEDSTLLFEWVTPTNPIVLHYAEPAIKLIGVVNHEDYSYAPQKTLDILAELWQVERPKYYLFNSVEDALERVELWRDAEGVVLYSEDGQILKKIKGEWYKHQHYFKTGMRSIKRAILVWEELGGPRGKQEFFDLVEAHYDHEVATILADFITTIGDFSEKIYANLDEVKRTLPQQPEDRKARALWLQEHNDIFKSLGFLLLSGREVTLKDLTKILLKNLT